MEAADHEAIIAEDEEQAVRTITTEPHETLTIARRIIAKIRASTKLWEALEGQLKASNMPILRPILDSKT